MVILLISKKTCEITALVTNAGAYSIFKSNHCWINGSEFLKNFKYLEFSIMADIWKL